MGPPRRVVPALLIFALVALLTMVASCGGEVKTTASQAETATSQDTTATLGVTTTDTVAPAGTPALTTYPGWDGTPTVALGEVIPATRVLTTTTMFMEKQL